MKYQTTVRRIVKSGDQDTLENTNAVEFVNRGEATVFVNNEALATNQSTSYSGHAGEIDITRYKIAFDPTGTKLLFMKMKNYV